MQRLSTTAQHNHQGNLHLRCANGANGKMKSLNLKSIRDKSGSHRRSKSSEPGKSRGSDILSSIFKPNSKQHSKEDEEKEAESAKVDEILARLPEENIHDVDREAVLTALASQLADGNVEAAIEFIRLQRMSFAGVITPYNPKVNMLGAENRGNVTCYLDALLFAMFAKMPAFECMLKNDHKGPAERLAALIRLWVNLLRHGKLIHTDITENLQNALAECGFHDARLLEQQDTSEAFVWITEQLQLPLLALQADMFHQGKGDPDDHKVVYERLLSLAIPEDPDGKGVKLEDCLEEYLNAKVDVHRDSFDEKKSFGEQGPLLASPIAISPNALSPDRTIRLVPSSEEEDEAADADPSPLKRRWTTADSLAAPESTSSDARPPARHRSTSLIQRIVVDEEGKTTEVSGADSPTLLNRVKRQGSTVIKAVTVPAFQFFRLIPFVNTTNRRPKDDLEVVRQFNQKPVVCICLKRYFMTEAGEFNRLNTYIDIPDSLRLPHFMLSDDAQREANDLNAEYKLVLQSVVCHRGESLQSGHYISFARVNPKLLTENRRHDADPPPDYEEAQWVKFDDLCIESRVTPVDDIKASLVEEMPYLLFYQIVPLLDVTSAASTTEGTDESLPPYIKDSAIFTPPAHTTSGLEAPPTISRQASGYFDNATWTTGTAPSSTGPSIRFSSEMDERPSIDVDRPSTKDNNGSNGFLKSSRRGSVAFSEPIATATTPGESEVPPAVTPSEESTAQRLSRAAARYMTTRSRPTSQAGEGRVSSSKSRLGGLGNLMRGSKEPLRKSEDGGTGGEMMTNGLHTRGGEDPNAHSPLPLPSIGDTETGATTPGQYFGDQRAETNGEEKEKDKGKKKERAKSKNRNSEVDAKAKDVLTVETDGNQKGKDKGRPKKNKHGEPERECLIM